jgi:hypothetical protein
MKKAQAQAIIDLLTDIRGLLRERFDESEYELDPAKIPRFDPRPSSPGAHFDKAFPLASNPQDGPDDALLTAIPLPRPRPAGSLKSVGGLPDPTANPGATNPDVTQENMATTIFVSGWTARVRPPVSFTNALKQQQMVEYGLSGPLSDYEEDHIVPLECGGAPHDPANLWPQLRTGQWGARTKDLTENAANAALRAGTHTLQEIQDGFKTDWKALHAALFSNPAVVRGLMAMEPPEDEP